METIKTQTASEIIVLQSVFFFLLNTIDVNYFLCFKRLSLLMETRVPTVWNICTKMIKQIREGTLSGIITFTMICIGEAPMLWAVSMMLGFTSRKLLSTKRATKGKAAITSGTMDAGVPTTVPITNLVKGKTKIIKIKNGMERSKLMIIFKICSIHFGMRNTLHLRAVLLQ